MSWEEEELDLRIETCKRVGGRSGRQEEGGGGGVH